MQREHREQPAQLDALKPHTLAPRLDLERAQQPNINFHLHGVDQR